MNTCKGRKSLSVELGGTLGGGEGEKRVFLPGFAVEGHQGRRTTECVSEFTSGPLPGHGDCIQVLLVLANPSNRGSWVRPPLNLRLIERPNPTLSSLANPSLCTSEFQFPLSTQTRLFDASPTIPRSITIERLVTHLAACNSWTSPFHACTPNPCIYIIFHFPARV